MRQPHQHTAHQKKQGNRSCVNGTVHFLAKNTVRAEMIEGNEESAGKQAIEIKCLHAVVNQAINFRSVCWETIKMQS